MTLEVWAPDGMPEVATGDDLAGLVLAALADLRDGDIVCVTSKVVSKAEGRTRTGDREDAIDEETVRVVARRGSTRIVRTRHGLTMAAAGVDASNVDVGSIVLLPLDPDASARALRRELHARSGANVGVVVTDTAGRAWREGQTDIAIGAAGLIVAEDFAGRTDPHGNPLAVTLPAVADEIAGAAELAQGKLAGRPVAVVRGRGDLVLPPGEDGPGAASLIRPEGGDMFGWGAREAVVQTHCHQYAELGFDPDREAMARAGLKPKIVEGCCGLAGNFGFEKGHYDVSIACAEQDLLPALRDNEDALVIADGFSCRTQIRHTTEREPVHLASALAARLGVIYR